MRSLDEPYQRFPCNELRRECYRRKLPVIKSGPHSNATKAGFIKLLRDADAQVSDEGESEMSSARNTIALDPVPFVALPVTLPRVVSPPTSPIEPPIPFLPARPPRINVGKPRGVKRQVTKAGDKEDDAKRKKKRQKSVSTSDQPQSFYDDSYFSTEEYSSNPSVIQPLPVPTISSLDSFVAKKLDSIEDNGLSRWERLHARLEVVTTKLAELHKRRSTWQPSSVDSNNDDSDINFYELMRSQLQRSLLECVSQT